MKNYFLLIILMTFTYSPLKAQFNLVPNPSFEDVLFCPNGLGQVYLANSWASYGYSPDIFCSCSTIGINVPFNVWSFQYANSGNCMVGLITYRRQNGPTGPNTREYVGTELIQPLSIGQKYYFSCYINFAYGPATNIASNNFGIKLLNHSADSSQPTSLISNSTIIYSDSIFTDTLSWYKLSGSFIADSAYTHIALGNFLFDNLTDTISFGTFPPEISYYFLDDICLSSDSAYCNFWTFISGEISALSKIVVFPNPTSDKLTISNSQNVNSISIINSTGILINAYHQINQDSFTISFNGYSEGIYFIKIETSDEIIVKKIVKIISNLK
jgi:hypothetical protein